MHDELTEDTHEETREKYQRLVNHHRKEMDKALAVLRVLDGDGQKKRKSRPLGTIPPIYDIQKFLEARGKPCLQAEIVKVVGDIRKEKYPHIRQPYRDVWKSLKYHDDHDREVVCVELKEGKVLRGKLKDKLKRPRIKGGSADRAEFHSRPDNLFGKAEWIEENKSDFSA